VKDIGEVFYPEAFNSKHVKTHWDFENDLKSILERSGCEADFCGKYKQRLRWLDERQEQCTLKKDWFEKLKHAGGLFSMKFNKAQKNIRIVFAFANYKGVKYALLLFAFEEKDNKNKSQYSYDAAIPTAQNRLKEVFPDG